jgi:hypothetical protein
MRPAGAFPRESLGRCVMSDLQALDVPVAGRSAAS